MTNQYHHNVTAHKNILGGDGVNTNNVLTLEIPNFYPKQIQFMKSKSRYTAYGGARGKQLCLLTGQNR